MAFNRDFDRRGGGGFNRSYEPAPVKEGEEIDVKIEALGEKGDGLAKIDSFVIFVPNTKVGDEVKIRLTRVLRKVGFAEVVGKASGPVKSAEKEEKAEEAEEEEAEAKPKKGKKAKKEETEEKEVDMPEEDESEDDETF